MDTKIPLFDILIMVAYIVFIAVAGLWRARNVKNSEDFLVAGRSVGLFVLVGTLVMTEFNTASMVAYSSFGYMAGLYAGLCAICFLFGFAPYTFIVARRWKRLNAVSMAEMFEQRYDKNFRLFVSAMLIVTLFLFSTTYLKAASIIFSVALNLDLTKTVILISGIVLILTLAGGLLTVAWTNMLSFLLTIVALPLLFFISWKNASVMGGMGTVFEPRYLSVNPQGMWFDKILPFEFIFTLYFLLFLVYMLSPWYAQIMFSTKDEKTAFKGMFFTTILVALVYLLSILTSAFVRVGFPNLTDPQEAMAQAIVFWMPVGIRGLMLALIFAVCQTTMATIWNNNVSLVAQDFYRGIINPGASEKKMLLVSRALTLLLAVGTMIVSIYFVDVVIEVMLFGNIFMVSLFFAGVGGFLFWHVGKKAAWMTTILGILSGVTIFFMKNNYNNALPGWLQNHDWLFLYCCIAMPVVVAVGTAIALSEKSDEDYLNKKVSFFTKVGSPWFGKSKFLKNKAIRSL